MTQSCLILSNVRSMIELFLFCFLLLLSGVTTCANAKKLVIFAGPHETAGVSVNSFFAEYAANDGTGSSSFDGWSWPIIENDKINSSPRHVFDSLILDQDNEEIQTILLNGIKSAWDASDKGVVIGSLLFDQVSDNNISEYDAVGALQQVVNTIGVAPEDIIVAITYRSPKFEHWASVYANHFEGDYKQFICSDDQADKRYIWLDTSMNPFKITQVYHQLGWNTVVVDQQGTVNAGKDVAHVIACYAMNGENCNEDWVVGLEDVTIKSPSVYPIEGLDDTQLLDLEELFLQRECYYMTELDGQPNFILLNRDTAWKDCELRLRPYYEQFVDTGFLLNAIQSQKDCEQNEIDVPTLLARKEQFVSETDDNKKLIVFVGPHETDGDDVTKFFAKYASTNPDAEPSPSFDGWAWPVIESVTGRADYRIFDLLITRSDSSLEDALLAGILNSWSTSEKGIIIGSLLFDRVGKNPETGYDAVGALRRVVDTMGIDDKQVMVVVSYRTPRIGHWDALFESHFEEPVYEDFVCANTQANKRWEWLDTVMDPFKIARTYYDQGWQVAVVDQQGAYDERTDVSHVIACEIMEGVLCEGGYVAGLQNITSDPFPSNDIDYLSTEEQSDLEELFLGRDCHYRDELAEKEGFRLLKDSNIWGSCTSSRNEVYLQLAETDFLLNAIQSQKGCEQFEVDIASLVGSPDTGATSSGPDDDKKLVIFVGPHETNGLDVLEFFTQYATGSSTILGGWIWPLFDSDLIDGTGPHKVFDLLVRDPDNDEVQNLIVDGIRNGLETGNGVIIGSLDFDRVDGKNPATGFDPLGAIRRLVDALDISDDEVRLVVTYRLPRVDQWSLLFGKHFDEDDYSTFVCSDDELDKKWEIVDTSTNPLRIAKHYRDAGWDVTVIDQEGTIHAGLDVSHTLACNVLNGVICEDGWVKGLEDVQGKPLETFEIDTLTEENRYYLEEVFLARDCHYKYKLQEQDGVQILNQHELWSSCSEQNMVFYDHFVNVDYMLEYIEALEGCAESDIDVAQSLDDKFVEGQQKKLVLFIGPHETNGYDVLEFFVKHASDFDGSIRSSSFDGWSWPTIESEILYGKSPYRIFDLLVSDKDERPVQNILLDGIRDTWNNSTNGVIIGTLNFDRVGPNPESGFDPLDSVARVVQSIGASNDDVTVVLTYRSPKLGHWSSVWWNHFEEAKYEDFLCSDTQEVKRWEWLDTVMNPLKVIQAYLEEGYNTVVIDQEGATIEGKDVAHTFACGVLDGVDCENGWIRDLTDERIQSPESYEINDLTTSERIDLEMLFQLRDCFYKYSLEPESKFSVLNKRKLWEQCSRENLDKYEQLTDTDFFLDVLRTQKQCASQSIDLSFYLLDTTTTTTTVQRERPKNIAGLSISVAILAVIVTLMAILLASRRKKIRRAAKGPLEGIFRDTPTETNMTTDPYRDGSGMRDRYTDDDDVDLGDICLKDDEVDVTGPKTQTESIPSDSIFKELELENTAGKDENSPHWV